MHSINKAELKGEIKSEMIVEVKADIKAEISEFFQLLLLPLYLSLTSQIVGSGLNGI